MQYRLLHTLGQLDARKCNESFGAKLSLDKERLAAGSVIELPDAAYKYLTNSKSAGGKGYVALMEPAGSAKGEAKKPEVTAPAK